MQMLRGFECLESNYYGPRHVYPSTRFDGRFWQPADETTCTARLSAAQKFVEIQQITGAMPLDVYQDWVELDWKAPHGSWKAVERFGKKLVDEELAQEIIPELRHHRSRRESDKIVDTAHLTDEIGDYLWPLTALASNGGVSINSAVRDYVFGDHPSFDRQAHLVLADIDKALDDGFNPTKGPLDYQCDEDEFEEYDPGLELAVAATSVRVITEKQYSYNERPILPGDRERIAYTELAPVIGRAIMVLGYITHQWARATFVDVVTNNVRKVSARAAHNLIDKTDGDRSKLED